MKLESFLFRRFLTNILTEVSRSQLLTKYLQKKKLHFPTYCLTEKRIAFDNTHASFYRKIYSIIFTKSE